MRVTRPMTGGSDRNGRYRWVCHQCARDLRKLAVTGIFGVGGG